MTNKQKEKIKDKSEERQKNDYMKKRKYTIYRIVCPYNNYKIFVIKHYDDGHYYWNAEVSGYMKNSRFTRTSKRWIKEVYS